MGAFDQFKDQSEKVADQAKEALGKKRRKGGAAQGPEQMGAERGMRQDQRGRGSDSEKRAPQRMRDAESGLDENDWA
ncbi:hypothetical protein [Streptomyces sp.]|uniref:hypothetical protein n=1 Tax=Streptomyces sp. TaxID=1931 RepID=UPI002F40568C